MPEKDLSSSNAVPSIAKIEGVIIMLTVLIRIGRYLPWIVLAFAAVSMILAVLCFILWNNMLGGIINLVLAIAGFVFFAQLVKRRKIHRYNYGYTRRNVASEEKTADESKVPA